MSKTVSILMAVYKPNVEFFLHQLRSINRQTYKALRLYICDDSMNTLEHQKILDMVKQEITHIPFIMLTNTENIGSSQTFEKLTKIAQGDYFAYADQDDIWDEHKIERLVGAIEKDNSLLAYSHLRVIDEQGEVIAQKFSEYNPRIQMMSGENLFEFFIRRNCITGCSLLVDGNLAKQALPFSKDYIHDHWLGLFASIYGKITLVEDALVSYRIHGNNQIGRSVLKGVETIDDYVPYKLTKEYDKFSRLQNRLHLSPQQKEMLDKELQSVQARISWFEKPSVTTYRALKRFKQQDKQLAKFETLVRLLPKKIANKIIQKVK